VDRSQPEFAGMRSARRQVVVPSYKNGTAKFPPSVPTTQPAEFTALADPCLVPEARGNRDDTILVRPDKRHARALVEHTRANYVTGVTHAESKRPVHPRQRADLESHTLTDIENDPNVARGMSGIDALAHDPTRVVDAKCGKEVASVRCRLCDDRRAGPRCRSRRAASCHC
jgi:hypothetical protein